MTSAAVTSVLPAMAAPAFFDARAAAPARGAREAFSAVSDEFDFLADSWAQIGHDGSVRVGIFPARAEARRLKALALPKVGDVLAHGGTLATVRLADGEPQEFAVPLSGEVVELNEALRIDPNPVWHDPCHAGWLVRMRPHRPMQDLWGCAPRRVVLLGADSPMRRVEQRWLAYYGCAVQPVSCLDEAVAAMHGLPASVLALDAGTFNSEGLAVALRVRAKVPLARVIALMGPNSRWQRLYGASPVICGAVDSVFDYDLAEALHAVFRRPRAVVS